LIEEELKRARDTALDALRLKSEFLTNMSHELRTPLNGVIGMSRLLTESDLPLDQADCAETIRASSESLLAIINDILEFTRLEADKLEFNSQPFNLIDCVEEAADFLALGAQTKGLALATQINSDVPASLSGDRGRLRQILVNLIGNAIKFTDKGEVIVKVSKINETVSHTTILCEVIDTGIGIYKEDKERIFNAFTQADGSAKRKFGGTGLGLAICKQLINRLGGEIGVESEKDQGSKFWFTVQFEKSLNQPNTISNPTLKLRNNRVLIVSKNRELRDIVQHYTLSWGMEELCLDDYKEVVAILRKEAMDGKLYSHVIMVITNPEFDWKEFSLTIVPELATQKIKLLVVTQVKRGCCNEYFREMEVDWLSLPLRKEQLYQSLSTVVRDQTLKDPLIAYESVIPSKEEDSIAFKNGHVRILLAEDNIVNQKVTIRLLEKIGYKADIVENGRAVLEALSRQTYDIILMDCMMPEMDGYEATIEIRKRNGELKSPKIIALTANALVGDREKCLAAGMDDYLSKPVNTSDLKSTLEYWTSQAVSSHLTLK
jgi:two-component system, sensor histidine kinase and response regulator